MNQTEKIVQIWYKSVGAIIPILELPTQYPAIGLPLQELALLNQSYCADKQEACPVEDLMLDFTIGDLKLSPNKQWLAWVEAASWCPYSRCYGLLNLVVWNIKQGDRQVLVELPFHIERYSTNSIDTIVWSPSSKEIAFIQSKRGNTYQSIVQVIDIETGQINNIAEGQGLIVWAPSGEQLAFLAEDKVKITARDGSPHITLDNNWVTVSGIDWSPDGSKLVITGATEDVWQEEVFIADLITDHITRVNIAQDKSSSFLLPKWSPDGQMIGVQATTREKEIVNNLLIFDPEDETIKANLTINRQQHLRQEWYWSDNGDAILLNLPSGKGISLFYWRDNRVA